MRNNVYQYNKNLVRLTLNKDLSNPNMLSFELMADDPDDTSEDMLKAFEQMYYDIVLQLSNMHVVMFLSPYKKIKREHKKLFSCKWFSGRYSEKGATTKLKQYLIDSCFEDGLFADVVNCQEKKRFLLNERYYQKALYILQEQIDIKLFDKANQCYFSEAHYGSSLTVFVDDKINFIEDAQRTICKYLKEKNTIAEISSEIVLPRMCFSINEKYIKKSDFIEMLKKILENHNKILEVNK